MLRTSPVILIFGYGLNVGHNVARAFASKSYQIATVSRSLSGESNADQIHISADLSDPHCIKDVFSEVTHYLGSPSVIVYKCAVTLNDPEDPLSLSLANFSRDLNINITSAFAAAQQSVLGFKQLPKTNLGAGKSTMAHVIQSAATSYSKQGLKFYYADERRVKGAPMYNNISGEAHGKFYAELAEQKSQGPWLQTFVKDIGYMSF